MRENRAKAHSGLKHIRIRSVDLPSGKRDLSGMSSERLVACGEKHAELPGLLVQEDQHRRELV